MLSRRIGYREEHLAPLRFVDIVYLRNDLEIKLCVLDVHHDLPSVRIHLVKSASERLRQCDEGPNDARHPYVGCQHMLPKVPQDVVSAYAKRVGILHIKQTLV